MLDETVYIKIDAHVLVRHPQVKLGDVCKVECVNGQIAQELKQIVLYEFPKEPKKSKREHSIVVFSILKVVEEIVKQYPKVQVVNLGEIDFIIEYKYQEQRPKWVERLLLVLLCVITFFGTAFTIMAFNNDISITEVFDRFYRQIVGGDKPQVSELEVCYSIGITIGIMVFFNHIGRKKITADPTPIQMEMRKYENDMNTTLIQNASRKGHNEDVD